jgi:hypothetical protein
MNPPSGLTGMLEQLAGENHRQAYKELEFSDRRAS